MEFKGKIEDYTRTYDNDFVVTFKTRYSNISEEEFLKLKDEELDFSLKKHREKRSMNANAYAWVLLDKIAEVLKCTKEDVYKHAIKSVGVFEVLPIKDIAVASFKRRWKSKGLGWVCEELGSSKIKDYTNVVAYYGSSTYDTKEMSRFIDFLVEEAKGLGIETKTPEEIEDMKSLWSEYEKENI